MTLQKHMPTCGRAPLLVDEALPVRHQAGTSSSTHASFIQSFFHSFSFNSFSFQSFSFQSSPSSSPSSTPPFSTPPPPLLLALPEEPLLLRPLRARAGHGFLRLHLAWSSLAFFSVVRSYSTPKLEHRRSCPTRRTWLPWVQPANSHVMMRWCCAAMSRWSNTRWLGMMCRVMPAFQLLAKHSGGDMFVVLTHQTSPCMHLALCEPRHAVNSDARIRSRGVCRNGHTRADVTWKQIGTPTAEHDLERSVPQFQRAPNDSQLQQVAPEQIVNHK